MFMNSSQDINGSVQHTTHTEGNVQTNTIEWNIPDFLNILNNKSISEIRAPKPTTPPVESKYHLMLQFLGEERSLTEIYYLSTTPELFKSVVVEIPRERRATTSNQSLFNTIPPQLNTVPIGPVTFIARECQFVQANTWQYLTHLFKLDATDSSLKKIVLENGRLCLTFKFVVTVKPDGFASFLATVTEIPKSQLNKDLETLFNDGIYSDVVVKSADNEEFRVHKALLASRSPVLKAFFAHKNNESTTNIVESPLESEVLREVLSFIYTDRAPKIDEISEQLLAAADYYQLNQLKSLCEEALCKKLSVDNAIEILQLADLHTAKSMKQQTLKFIKYGPLKSIMKTKGWDKLQSVELIKEICDYCN